jgi:hypothetical protein
MRVMPRLGLKLSIGPTILGIVCLVKFLFPLFEDPDFYWHVKTGESLIFGAHPYLDTFTHTRDGVPRVLSAWLAEIVFFLVHAAGGELAVGMLAALLYTMCWYLSYAMSRKILDDEAKAVIVTLIFCGLFGAIAPRPHLFTFLFFAALLYLLLDVKYFRRDRRLWLIPVILLLWANLHGGFFLGLVLLAVFLASEWTMHLLESKERAERRKRLARLSMYAVAALLATVVNPHGFEFWLYPYRAIVSSGDMAIINEWQSPNFHSRFFQYFLATVFAFFLCMVYSRKKPDLTELAVPLVFVTGAFIAVRNLPLAALAMAPFFAVFYKHIAWERFARGLGHRSRGNDRRNPLTVRLMAVVEKATRQVPSGSESRLNLIVLVGSLAAVAVIYPFHQRKLQASIDELLPVKAVDFVVANGIDGKMFNTYHYGGYLLYRLYPDQKVFVYGRTDIYPQGFLTEFNAVYRGEPDWKASFDKYEIDYVICESKAPLRQLLLAGDAFRLVYDDSKHSVLVRDSAKYRSIIAQYAREPDSGNR